MRKILSLSKMRETIPLPPLKDRLKRSAIFMKGEHTNLEDSDYEFLKKQEGGPFNFLIGEGTFIVSELPKEEEPKPLSKKDQKKLDAVEKKAKVKKAAEDKKARQGK